MAEDAGADAIGVVVFSDSPRSVAPEAAREIFSSVGPYVTRVCVSTTESPGDIETMLAINPDAVQVSLPLEEKLPVRTICMVDSPGALPAYADAIAVDASRGTGRHFDASLAEWAARESTVPVILAGGSPHRTSPGRSSASGPMPWTSRAAWRSPPAERTRGSSGLLSGRRRGLSMTDPSRFGVYGGRFVPETLMAALEELEHAFRTIVPKEEFQEEMRYYLHEYAGRKTPLTFCRNVSRDFGCRVYLKREDLLHSGAHKLNNALGQALLARFMGKRRLIAETGAGQHGVATAIAGAVLGMKVAVYMGDEDIERQALNVARMKMLGAQVVPVSLGSRTLKDAINEALRDWVANVETTHYLIGSVVGPHPFPTMVRDFQTVIGTETREQVLEKEGRLPDAIVACVGGGSNAIGIFTPFLDEKTRLYGAEAGGEGPGGRHGATLCRGRPGVLHGAYSYLIQDAFGQILESHSISAGLDYPGVGPEHSFLRDCGRVSYYQVTDREALDAFFYLSRSEGIIPALESAHAVSLAERVASGLAKDDILVINLSGRGDKDVAQVAALAGDTL